MHGEPEALKPPALLRLLNGNPHALATFLGLDDFLLQAVQPDVRVEHLAHFAVLAHEDAPFGVFRAAAFVYADALPFAVEIGPAKQNGQPLFELRTPGNHHRIAPFGDGRAAFHLVGAVFVVAPGGFEGVSPLQTSPRWGGFLFFPLNGRGVGGEAQPTDGVGLAFGYTF